MRNRKHDIERYLRGELSPAEMHALEKEALNDPFLAEALEGIEHAGADNFLFDLHKLNKSVHHRARRRQRHSKTVKMWGWSVGIAASVLLIAVSGYLVVSLLNNEKRNDLAMKEQANPLPEEKPDTDTVAKTLDEKRTEAPSPIAGPSLQKKQPAPSDATAGATHAAGEKAIIAEDPTLIAGNDKTAQEILDDNDVQEPKKDVAANEIAESAPVLREQQSRNDPGVENTKRSERKAGVSSVPSATQRAISDFRYLNGRVRSAEDGTGLPGVNVIVKGTNIGTVTNSEGFFNLSLPADQTAIVFSFIGFESTEVAVGDNREVEVAMNEDVSQLSEVVVTGAGTTTSESAPFTFAEPVGGRSQFKDYLSKALKYPRSAIDNKTQGRVTIRFTVQPDGKLADFQVLKGIGSGCEEELIRLVKEGPAWKSSTKDNQPIADQVRVRYKFELPGR